MKTIPVIALIFILLFLLLSTTSCNGPSAAVPEDNSEWAEVLARKFSPIILLKNDEHPYENYEPAPVETMIDQALIRVTDTPSFAEEANISSMMQYSGSSYYLDIPGISPADFSQSLSQYKMNYDQAMASDLHPTVYARVLKPGDSGHTVVQYWLFYYFDEWSNLHEGDWELVTLVFPGVSAKELIETGGEPEFAAYTQHQAGQKLSWADMRNKGLIIDTHPLVYVGRGSHANYFTPGQYWIISDFDDTGLNNWREIIPQLIMISEKDPGNNQNEWLDFRGCWGEHLDFTISARELTWTQCGPNGPEWGGQGKKSQRWQQPYQWAAKMVDYPQIYFASFLPEFARKWPTLAIFSVFSPADIHVYDRYGNHAGLNERGEFESQIPGAEYIAPEGTQSKTIIIPDGDVSQGYTLIIKGTGYGAMDVKAQVPDAEGKMKRYLEYRDIDVTPTTVARLQFKKVDVLPPPDNSESTRDKDTILEVDRNNDGEYESEVKPGTEEILPKPTLTLKVEGAGNARAIDGYMYSRNARAVIIAEPERGWVFDRWVGDASGTSPSVNVVMDRDKTIIAYFKPEIRQFSLAIGVEEKGGGKTIPGPGTYFFNEGRRVSIQALPEPGYELLRWSGDYGNSETLELIVDRDIAVMAIFRPIEIVPILDQTNDLTKVTWKASLNIMPETGAGQSIVAELPFLVAVEVRINTLTLRGGGDIITTKILDENQEMILLLSQWVKEGFDDWLMFEIPNIGGLYVGSGANLIIQLEDTGMNIFGWTHAADTYLSGSMLVNGKVQEGDFIFRTYGTGG